MRNSSLAVLLLFLAALFTSCDNNVEPSELQSPDGKLKITINLDNETGLSYEVWINEDGNWVNVMESSPLGIMRSDADFATGLIMKEIAAKTLVDESYKMLIGNSSEYRNYATERIFRMENADGKTMNLICRAFNEGVAFRYEFPGKDTIIYEITGEKTGFNLPDKGKAWLQPYDTVAYWAPAYEQFFENGIEIGTTAPWNKNGWCFPMLFETGDHWIYISEAGLDPTYCGTHLQPEAPDGLYTIRFPEDGEADNYCGQNPHSKLPIRTPWRYILVSRDKEVIMNSNHVYHLSEPSRIPDISWIKTGVASWSWWSEGSSPRDFDALKAFVDFSAEMGWEYSLVDAGWQDMKGGNIEELIKYANSKKIGILLWYDSGSRVKYTAGNPQSAIMFNNESREAEMKRIASMGAKGVKVDFFNSDKQCTIKLYYDILEDAAKNRLVVNFHGCAMPRGWSRTYPNLLTMEGIRGAEAYRFDRTYPEYGPVNNTIIPFTRNVAGPMDYTPLTISDSKYPHTTTTAHELALGVVFHSGIQHFADHWKTYKALPGMAKEYLRDVPVVWDESRLIEGYPGEYIIIARRSGKDWYIAGINGTAEPMEVSIDLDFFPPGTFDMMQLTDGQERDDLNTERKVVTKDDKVEVSMQPRGGFCVKTGIVRPLN